MGTALSAGISAYLHARAALRKPWLRGRTVRVFLDPTDPYSTLLAQALKRLIGGGVISDEHRLQVHIVPAPEAQFDPAPDERKRYGRADCARLAQRWNLDFPTALAPPPGPLFNRTLRIMSRARKASEQLDAMVAAGAALWNADPRALVDVVRDFGDTADSGAIVRGGDELRRLGHYQGSMCCYAGEWFWGVDRLELLLKRLGADAGQFGEPQRLATLPSVTSFDGWFSFRSPYSYLATQRAMDLAERAGVDLKFRLVLPMVMRGLKVPRAKRVAIAEDAFREARELGIGFGRVADPLGVGVERCMAVAQYAALEGRVGALLVEAGRAIWSEGIRVASDAGLRTVVERAGLDWNEARGWLNRDGWRDEAEQNRKELVGAGLWGVPCFRVGEVVLWGQDRLEQVAELLGASAP